MKIIFLNRSALQSSYLSGVPRRAKELIEGMRQKGWNVQVFNIYNVSLRKIFPRFLSSLMEITLSFLRIVKAREPPHAIIFFSTLDGLTALFYKLLFRNTKVIFCDRGDAVKSVKLLPVNSKVDRLIRCMELIFFTYLDRIICLKSDKIIFNSMSRLKETERRVRKKLANVQVIPNNANPSWVRKWLSEISENSLIVNNTHESWRNKKVIGFVGNLYEAGNGLDILLKAFKIIVNQVPEAILVIVGDGPDKEILQRKVVEMSIDDKVHFTGGVPNPLIYVKNFDIFVHPARHHSCPNAILEALMCGVPVIGSRVGGIPEILKDDDLLFNPNDVNELTDKIIRFFSEESYSKKLKKLVFELRQKYIFDWQEEMCLSIYETINHRLVKT